MSLFVNGNTVTVIVRGPGKLNLLSYQSNAKLQNTVGSLSTPPEVGANDITRFVISHSYTFERFAFVFDGEGEAVVSIGSSLLRTPVGKKWIQATIAAWGATSFTSADIIAQVQIAVDRDNAITAFIVPGLS